MLQKLAGSLLRLISVIRYRFESAAEFERHLRLGDGVFFVPGVDIAGMQGERVVVEIVFPHTDDSPMLHGRLLSRPGDGVWLEAPSARAAARWAPGPDSPRRRTRRIACDLFVEIRSPDVNPWLCRALDLSETGIRLATGSFETGVAGDEVTLTLLLHESSPVEVRARLCWAGARAAGFELLEPPRELKPLLRVLSMSQRNVHDLAHSEACPCSTPPATGQRQP